MQTYRLRHRDHTTLFEGTYRSHQDCVEDALNQGICLNGANFSRTDLSEINLDGAELSDVIFSGANLTGANISEAVLHHCSFEDTSLFNTCFAHSNLTGSVFSHAGFGGTDITATILDDSVFSGLAALGLKFYDCHSMEGAHYQATTRRCSMSSPPIVITGLNDIVALFDQDVMIGTTLFSVADHVCLQDTAAPVGSAPAELYKTISLLQRLKPAYDRNKIVATKKSTKS